MSLFTAGAAPGRPYWWEDIDWPDLTGAPPERVDLMVIGAGYAGMSAAIAAHDAGARVAVVDAAEPGQGASSRNGGMVGAHPRLGWDALATAFGPQVADAVFAEAAPALDWLRDLIVREGIACDFQETGRIQLAYTRTHFARQRLLAQHLRDKTTVCCRLLDRSDLPAEIVTPLYHGGLLFPDHGAFHPAKFHRGLLGAALRRAIPVISHCPVVEFHRAGQGHLITTRNGKVRASQVVLATNGYTGRRFRWFAARVFPLPSYLIATEPLSPDVIGKLVPGRRMMVETRARHNYFRVSPDGSRLLFGGRAAMVPIDPETAARRLCATMVEVFPELAGTRLSHVWTGDTGYSFNHMPHVGAHEGIHYAMGFSGSGTVLAPYLGAKAALRALGDPAGETAYEYTALTSRWFHRGGTPRFLRPADLWYRHWVDRRENRAADRDARPGSQ